MPIYEFRCEGCGQIFEHLALSRSEEGSIACPHCGGQELSRVMSVCSAITDGGGKGERPQPQVQNRSCANAGSCTTITLPGYER
jgi:putative FmdB family regulatory protein